MRLFSTKNRPLHKGSYPTERLIRLNTVPTLTDIEPTKPLTLRAPEHPTRLTNAMADYQAMMDVLRVGKAAQLRSGCPEDETERSQHIKSFGYFNDASDVGICRLSDDVILDTPVRNKDIDTLAEYIENKQTTTLASGIDVIMADLRESIKASDNSIKHHTHAVVFLFEYPRDPHDDEPGSDWITDAQQGRAALRASECAIVLAQYFRLYGYDACAHTATSSDVNINALSVAAGLTINNNDSLEHPYIGTRFGLSAITTDFSMQCDRPLADWQAQNKRHSHGLGWQTGKYSIKNARNYVPFAKRRFIDGEHPFETLKRVDTPTTYLDEERIPRVPKRTDMFARSLFGDLGKHVQDNARDGHYARKSAPSYAQRRALGALMLLQDGPHAEHIHPSTTDPISNANNVKAAAYFLGCDAVGISRCPEWTWYSHNAAGVPIEPPHDQAISIIIDQGYETMEGASGDDWISVAQSMRAYLRFSLLGGVIANHIRALGYPAKAHSVLDGEVLQPPLLLLAGLGEVSRIGEVILNPYLGPRLKSGAVTTTMPLAHDKPIDFGLQAFCENCNKCARECPSGAITAGPKLMFNGYEIWKSDSQRCTTYRITTPGGAMCGRCMKTCPWNLEGLFAEKPFRWAAMKIPQAARMLAKLDDAVGNGDLNPVKKWWWDLEWQTDSTYQPTEHSVNERGLQKEIKLTYESQTLAVYPANLAPQPWPFPSPMDREKGISAYEAMISSAEYRDRLSKGDTEGLTHEYAVEGDAPVLPVIVSKVQDLSDNIKLYELTAVNNEALPAWSAGAHIDVVIAPDYFRQYSLCGNPADRTKYVLAVQKEPEGKGGSLLMHRIFTKGRKLFISKPINHFPLIETAAKSVFLGGGIGVTPMIAMAHRAHEKKLPFDLHYSVTSRENLAFDAQLSEFDWSQHVESHISDEGTRLDLAAVFKQNQTPNTHVYACGPDAYMQAVTSEAIKANIPEENVHIEYFSVPEQPEYINKPFKIKLRSTGEIIDIDEDSNAAQVLQDRGFPIDLKCSDGLCGVCQCGLISGTVEHRDFVLSKKQQNNTVILCQSRALNANDTIEIDL